MEVLLEMVFLTVVRAKGYKGDNWSKKKKTRSWRGAAVQRGLEPGNRETTVVKSRYLATTTEDREDFMCAVVTVIFGVIQ
jgi:hypothetical protein